MKFGKRTGNKTLLLQILLLVVTDREGDASLQGKAGLLAQPNNQLVVTHRSDSFVEDLEVGVLVRGLHEGCEEDVVEVPELPRPLGAPDAQVLEIGFLFQVDVDPGRLRCIAKMSTSEIDVAKPRPLQAVSIPRLLGMLQTNLLILKEFNVVFLLLKQEWDALMLSNFALENQLHTARQKLSHLCIRSWRKVRPLRRMLKGLREWITGQRKDQSPSSRANIPVREKIMTIPRKEKKREARREEIAKKVVVLDMVFRRCTRCLEDAQVEKI
ncbi:hypothetical protein ZIOFF_019117 [Zingiber officinale]|uniref:Pre-mRNA-processing factor 19 n=1 Tax=Zingiber officinale TaxID=94328 RepID=A0A8J5LNF1_ZINOF|nr:hypothetical protein ZIOFF_019117 [Zingiber officinale]